MRRKILAVERVTHVHKIDDFVLQDVRDFLLLHVKRAPAEIQMSISDFLSATRFPYRAKSKSWRSYANKKSSC